MRLSGKLALAGAATLALAGAALAAGAEKLHTLNVALPDGSVARIHYVGDVAPRIVVQPEAVPVALMPAVDDPFLAFERIAAMMDAQAEAMLAGPPVAPVSAEAENTHSASLPEGTVSYTYVSSVGGAGGCTQSYRMTSVSPSEAPKVETSQSGDCRNVRPLVPVASNGQRIEQPAPAKAPTPDLRNTI